MAVAVHEVPTPPRRLLPRASRLREVPILLRSPAGRWTLWHHATFYAWPVLSTAARFYRRTVVARVPLVAVVGSLGKSTTAACVSTILGLAPAAHPELNGWSWVALSVLRTRQGQRAQVIEVGIDGPGQMRRHADIIRPDLVVVTSITAEHNRSLPSLHVTRQEKAQMVRRLGSSGVAVLNGDDANVRWMAGQTRGRVVWFGLGADNDVRAVKLEVDWPHGTVFTLQARGQVRRVRIPLLGVPGVQAVLAAIAVALEMGQDLDETLRALVAVKPVSGRLCPVMLPSGALLISDEKNSSEDSITAGLAALAELLARRRVLVMGEIFEPQEKAGPLYRSIGERVGHVADLAVFLVGRKRASPLRAGAAAAGMAPTQMHLFGHDLGRAIAFLGSELRRGDVVLLKGRGTEHLERITLGLQGRDVRCTLSLCKVPEMRCDRCPQLGIGRPW